MGLCFSRNFLLLLFLIGSLIFVCNFLSLVVVLVSVLEILNFNNQNQIRQFNKGLFSSQLPK